MDLTVCTTMYSHFLYGKKTRRLGGWDWRRGASTYTNEGNKLLIGVFIRAVEKQERFIIRGFARVLEK